MSQSTARLSLPLLAAAQSQKHVTHNEALVALDALVHLAVRERRDAPPASPAEGDRYLVGTAPTGAFAGNANAIAARQDGGWRFFAPAEGWVAWLALENAALVYAAGAWGDLKPRSANRLGIAASADDGNRLTVASAGTLFTHAGTDSRVKVNKAAAANTASLLFQTNFSGRAEMGLAGNDAFGIKVSSDGATWRETGRFEANASWLGGYRADVASDIKFHVARASGAVGVAVEVVSTSGTTLADFALQTELHTIAFRNEGRPGSCITGAAPEFQVRFPPPFGTSPLAVGPDIVVSNAPHRLRNYTTTTLPSAATAGAGALIHVTNAPGGAIPAFSDGTNWRSTADRSVVG